jgi:lysophospholipase L1-like esterase
MVDDVKDGNSYALNTPTDYIHPSAAGYDAMGKAAEALFAYTTAVIPRA